MATKTGGQSGAPEICVWQLEGDCWDSDCGHAFVFNEGGPVENDFKFCPYCGDPLAEVLDLGDEEEEAA